MVKEVPLEQQCGNTFERKPKGLRYVTARWRCKRKKLKGGLPYCSYCEPSWKKLERLEAKDNARGRGSQNG